MYELTKLDQPMSYKEISDKIRLDSKKISLKTVERWFNFLKQPYNHPKSKTKDKFDYFPTFYYEKIGLVHFYVISDNPAWEKLLSDKCLKYYQNYATWLFDPQINRSVLLTGYLIPIELEAKFKNHFYSLKKNKIVDDYKIYMNHTGLPIYMPWHEIINETGHFTNTDRKDGEQAKRLETYWNNTPKFKMVKEVKSNPLIIPTLFEYWSKTQSSYEVWQGIKKRIGNDVWKYIKKNKAHSDWLGAKKIQFTLKHIKNFEMFSRMKLVYLPLQLNNVFLYMVIKGEDKKNTLESIKKLFTNSIQLTVYPEENNRAFVIALIDPKNLPNLLNMIDELSVEKLFFLQHEKSLPLLTDKKIYKFNYEKLFDVDNLSWKNYFR